LCDIIKPSTDLYNTREIQEIQQFFAFECASRKKEHNLKRKQWNWGVLSTGHIAGIVSAAMQHTEEAILYAVASRDEARASAFAKKFGFDHAYGSYQALLDDPAVDIVYIALPNALHHEWTLKAARAGKHILTEKPLGISEAEVTEMFEAADAHDVLLMEAFKYPFHPQWPRFMEVVRSGRLGRLRAMQGTFCFPMKDLHNVRMQPQLAGGSIWDLGCYPVSFFTLVMEQEPIRVSAMAQIGRKSGVDETFAGLLEYEAGVLAGFECGFNSPVRQRGEVAGEEGVLYFPEPYHPDREAPTEFTEVLMDREEQYRFPVYNAFEGEVRHFCQCAADGSEPYFSRKHSVMTIRTLTRLIAAYGGGR
jgi:D-xylose 1-dehydrogenase (NADP+, D-xylono-1,5-lactone-forming)